MRMADLVKKFQLLCPELTEALEKNTHHFDRSNLNPYHLEGNTYAHTQMVCLMTEVLKVNTLIKIACLLHDVGKPMATKVDSESKKVKMYGHEGLSVFLGLKFLNSLELSETEKTMICQLITFHTFLYKAMREKSSFEKTVVDKFKGNHELLSNLIEMTACDALGRFADGEENRDFWTNALNNLSHLVYKCDVPKIERVTSGEAIILIGPPCSGKSSWISKNAPSHTICSRDDIIMKMGKGKLYSEAFKSLNSDKVNQEYDLFRKEIIKKENNIVFDLTHMTAKSRRKSLAGLPKDMKRTAVVFLTSFEDIIERNKKRALKEGKDIPLFVLENMMGSFDFPLISEGFDEIKVVF